jgi:hypothetical protein
MKLIKTIMPALLLFGVAPIWAGTLTGTVADYNAAQVRLAHGIITVPSGEVTYTATTTIPAGTIFAVTLPFLFEFVTPPTLSSASESDVSSGITLLNYHGGLARYTVNTSISSGGTITMSSYTVSGAFALEQIVHPDVALPLTMQALGIEKPVSFKEFASDTGIEAYFVGAIQFIDLSSPSDGRKFFGYPGDTLTAVLSAIEIQAETVDFATSKIPILSANGEINSLSSSDTVNVELPGMLYGGFKVFSSDYSDCRSQFESGKVTEKALILYNIPINRELFFCATGTEFQMLQIFPTAFSGNIGYVEATTAGMPKIAGIPKMAGIPKIVNGKANRNTESQGEAYYGFTSLELFPVDFADDYFTSPDVNVEFPGAICYTYSDGGGSCVAEYPFTIPGDLQP